MTYKKAWELFALFDQLLLFLCVRVWFSLPSEYTPGSVSHMNAIHHLSQQKKSGKALPEAI